MQKRQKPSRQTTSAFTFNYHLINLLNSNDGLPLPHKYLHCVRKDRRAGYLLLSLIFLLMKEPVIT